MNNEKPDLGWLSGFALVKNVKLLDFACSVPSAIELYWHVYEFADDNCVNAPKNPRPDETYLKWLLTLEQNQILIYTEQNIQV